MKNNKSTRSLHGGTLGLVLLYSKISTGRKFMKFLQREDGMGGLVRAKNNFKKNCKVFFTKQREDGMGGLVRAQHVCTYIYINVCV
jgi:hypothetical protein